MLALVTARAAAALDADMPLVRRELPEASVEVWDDPAVDWRRYAAVVVRSTWDYHERLGEFRAWCRRVEGVTRLWNPADLIEWNTDKRYLSDLERQGIPIVPTRFAEPGALAGGRFEEVSGDVVVKPSVGAGSNGAARFDHRPEDALAHVASLHAAGLVAMVQPYVTAVDERGETGLVYLAGRFSHAFRKAAILDAPIEWEDGMYAREQVEPRLASTAELDLGARVLATLPDTAYARVDVVPGDDGPMVLEVEVTEPSLFLHCDPAAPARAAAAFRSLAS